MQSVLFLQHVLNGLLAGTYYLLIALGLSLIFSLGGIVNLAHGAFYAIGAYLTVVLSPTIGFGGSIVVSPVLVGLLGIIVERTLFRRFYKADPSLSLILTFGLAMVAEQLLRMIFGAATLVIFHSDRAAWSAVRCWLHLSLLPPPRAVGGCGVCGRTLVSAAADGVRSRRACRRAEPGHGRCSWHIPRTLHGGGGVSRCWACGLGGRHACTDFLDPSGDGQTRSSPRPLSWS